MLGLVGRDLVFDMLDAVVAEDAPAAFALTERAIERGYDLRLLCRELARAMRDLLILSVDKSRASDPDVVGDGDRDRLLQLVDRWSREDLLRGFDLLTRTEQEIRESEQPRYNMEMALLRLMHLRKLVPLTDLLTGAARCEMGRLVHRVRHAECASSAPATPRPAPRPDALGRRPAAARTSVRPHRTGWRRSPAPRPVGSRRIAQRATASRSRPAAPYRDAFLAEVKAAKPTFYNLVVAQAFSIDASASGVTFAFQPNQKVPKAQCEDNRAWVQGIIEKVTGEKLPVHIVFTDAAGRRRRTAARGPGGRARARSGERKAAALEHETVRHLLEVFPVEKTTVQDE